MNGEHAHEIYRLRTALLTRKAGVDWDPAEHPRGAAGRFVTMYHGTSKPEAERITREGLHPTEGHIFPAKWPVTTVNRQTADAYAGGRMAYGGAATVELRVPEDKMSEFFWPAVEHIGGKAYAPRKQVPAKWVKAVHPVTSAVEYPP